MFSLTFNPQRENSNTISASEKLENPNKLVNAVTRFDNMTINNFG